MAVVSISRIQIRRGKKQAGSGLPQLASGELGWAIDTQELFIGNGSVAEGAPYVGNTKLLSEHDDLFQFADTYSYKNGTNIQTGTTANTPVLRTLQDRLDDRVSIRSFGAFADGTDQTVAIQRAIDQLYLNASNKGQAQARVELILEPGIYNISSTIYLPPYATLRGAGVDKTIFITSNQTVFKTTNDNSTVGNYADDSANTFNLQARSIEISDITIQTNGNIALDLISCRNSYFKNVKLKGVWNLGDTADKTNPAIKLTSKSTAVTCQDNVFENIQVENYSHGIVSNTDIKNNVWKNCKFDTLFRVVVFGEDTIIGTSGQLTGPINNTIQESTFLRIFNSAVIVVKGQHNLSNTNKYYDVGNEGGSSGNAKWPIIRFDTPFNQSENDWFQRTEELGFSPTFLVNFPYAPEISGPTISTIGYSQRIAISQYGEFSKLIKLPADTVKGYIIEYIYKSNQVEAYRSGTIELVVDPINLRASISDDYLYRGDTLFSQNLEFLSEVYDENGDGTVDTVAIMVLNSTSSDNATITFNIKSKS